MFNNIGAKIKTVAKVILVLGIILSVILGLVFMVQAVRGGIITGIIIGIIVMVIYALMFFVSALFIYGFGEIIEKVTEIAENTKKPEAPVHTPKDDNIGI